MPLPSIYASSTYELTDNLDHLILYKFDIQF